MHPFSTPWKHYLFQITKYQRHGSTVMICSKLMINIVKLLPYQIYGLKFNWVGFSLKASSSIQLELFRRCYNIIKVVSVNLKEVFYYEISIHFRICLPDSIINPIQDGPFRHCSRKSVIHILQWWNWHSYTLPKKIQKIFKSPETPFEVCWHQHFFNENQQILLYQEILTYIAF